MARRRSRSGGQLTATRDGQVIAGRGEQSRPASVTATSATQITQTASFDFEMRKGPIPDADEMIRYGQAHPDAPAIILDEFRTQAAHRRGMERRDQALDKKAMEASIVSERLGLVSALAISLVGFGCATYLVATGHGVEGTIIFGLDVSALVSAFILGRPRHDKQE